MRRGLIGGGVLAALWFLCGWAPYFLYAAGGSMATLAQLVPSPMGRGVFGSPVLWAAIVQTLTAVVLIAGYSALASRLSAGRVAFAAGWLAAILTAFAIGAVIDLGSFIVHVADSGIRGATATMGSASETTWWAVLAGWVPALLHVRLGRMRHPDSSRSSSPSAVSRPTAVASLIAVLALIALPFATEGGHNATQERLREEQAAEEGQADPSGAGAPDPAASGEPVPTASASDGRLPEGACTTASTTILAPAPDAATGHRGQSLSLVNVSEEACVVDGYPDIAYGDQNEHLLDVVVEHGRSFMAEDPGASPITLQPGESASAVIGWDANSVHGQLAARSLWIAVAPGEERLSWDVSLDIISGATVHVTAWQTAAPPGS
ncbi:hypothetical protein GCM10027421_23810 [Microbacterium shaanxiense]